MTAPLSGKPTVPAPAPSTGPHGVRPSAGRHETPEVGASKDAYGLSSSSPVVTSEGTSSSSALV